MPAKKFKVNRKALIYIGIIVTAIISVVGVIVAYSYLGNRSITIKIIPDGNSAYKTSGNLELKQIQFEKENIGIKIVDKNTEIGLTMESLGESKPTTELSTNSDSITYKNISEGTHLKYTPLKNGVKEEVIIDRVEVIKDLPSISYTFKMNMKGFNATVDANGYVSPTFVSKSNPKDVYTIPPAFMTDKKNEISYEVDLVIKKTETPDEYLIILIPSREWMMDESREYPIVIDPTIVKGAAPVGEWGINEGYGGTTGDSSGSSNTLTITNATWQVNQSNSGNSIGTKAIRFDGSGDYLTRAYDSDFDFGTGSFSISMWAKIPTAAAGPDILLSRYTGAGFKVYMDSNEYICFGIDADGTWTPTDSTCTTTTYNDSKWHHIEAVKTSTTSIAIYIDGVQKNINSSTSADGSLSGTSPVLYIGIDSDGTSNSYQGDIDQVTIYNYARDASQIKADAAGMNQTSVAFGRSKDTLQDGLVGYWKLDENTGTNTADASPSALSGTLTSGPTWSVGKFGSSVTFDATDDDIILGTSTLLDFTNHMTLSAWIYPTGWGENGSYGTIISHQGGGDKGFQFEISGVGNLNSLVLYNGSVGPVASSGAITLNTWQHVAAVVNNNMVTFYVNGVAVSSPQSYPMNPSDTANAYIGSWDGTNDTFQGRIDEVRAYNRALTNSEIKQLYNFVPGPVLYYSLDENAGTSTVSDRSGNGLTGTMNGSMTTEDWITGKFGSALDFDGTDDSIDAGDPSTGILDIPDGVNFTSSFWFNRRTFNTDDTIIAKENDQTTSPGYVIWIDDATDDIRLAVWDGDNVNIHIMDSSATFTSAGWHHVTVVYDDSSSTASKIYINGVLDSATNTTFGSFGSIGDMSNTHNFTIGADSVGGFPFSGYLDDIKFYKYALTASQVIEDMNGGHPVGGSPIGSQVGFWKFDETTGTTTYDWSPNPNNITLNNADWSTDGKVGSALSFDGSGTDATTSHAYLADNTYDTLTQGAISFWFKPLDTGDDYQNIFAVGDNSVAFNNGYLIGYNRTYDAIVVWIKSSSTLLLESLFAVPGSQTFWHHVTVSTDSSGHRVYIDGVESTGFYSTGTSAVSSFFDDVASGTTKYNIGCNYDGSGCDNAEVYEGKVDELKVYSVPLNAEQARIEYNFGKTTVMGALSTDSDGITQSNSTARAYCVPGDTSTCNPPVGEWKLDENTSTAANDTVGNMAAGTLTAGASWSSGKNGSAVNFGATGDYVTIPDPGTDSVLDFSTGETMTIEVWIKPLVLPGAGDYDIILIKGGTNGVDNLNYVMEIGNIGGNDMFDVCWQSGSYSCYETQSDKIEAGVWQHLAFVVPFGSASNSTVKAYYNGKPEPVSCTATCNNNPTVNNDPLWIGAAEYNGGGVDQEVNAIIDDVRIYNYERTPAQIAWTYNRGAPIASYTFDECTGTSIGNWVENANGQPAGMNGSLSLNGTPAGGAGTCTTSSTSWYNGAAGKFNASMDFDGDDYVQITGLMGSPANISMCAWVNLDSADSSGAEIISIGDTVGIRADSRSGATGTVGFYQDSANNWLQVHTDTDIAGTGWRHLCYVIDDTANTQIFYIDGQESNRTTGTNSIVYTGQGSDTFIGKHANGGTNYDSNGRIDEVRLYNFALTPVQVKQVMGSGAANFQ